MASQQPVCVCAVVCVCVCAESRHIARRRMLICYLLLFSETLGETRGWRCDRRRGGEQARQQGGEEDADREAVNEAFVCVCVGSRAERWCRLEV